VSRFRFMGRQLALGLTAVLTGVIIEHKGMLAEMFVLFLIGICAAFGWEDK